MFPLRVSANGRYLVDQAGRPFRLNLEAAWFLSTHASAGDVDAYLDDRAARGFTGCVVMAMVHAGGYDDFPNMPPGHMAQVPKNRHTGEGPFTVPGHFATVNDAYWQHIDHLVRAAAARNLVVLLAYAYLGYQGGRQGWWREINEPQNTEAVMFAYGAALARRYAGDPNVIWYPCGDYSPPPGSEGSLRVRASIAGIRSVLPGALFGAELNCPDDLGTDNPDFADVLDLNSFYGFGPGENGAVYETARRAWAYAPARPAFVGEPPYEGTPIGGTGGRADVRQALYYSVLGGGTAGQNCGTWGVWNVGADFRAAFDSPGTRDVSHMFTLFASLPWYDLEPADGAVTRGQRPGLEHIAVARTADRHTLLAYVPSPREFDLDGAREAHWFNPTSGVSTPAVAPWTTPGDNGTGAFDWVLVATT